MHCELWKGTWVPIALIMYLQYEYSMPFQLKAWKMALCLQKMFTGKTRAEIYDIVYVCNQTFNTHIFLVYFVCIAGMWNDLIRRSGNRVLTFAHWRGMTWGKLLYNAKYLQTVQMIYPELSSQYTKSKWKKHQDKMWNKNYC